MGTNLKSTDAHLCPHWIFYTFMNTLMYVMYINPMKFNVSMFQCFNVSMFQLTIMKEGFTFN